VPAPPGNRTATARRHPPQPRLKGDVSAGDLYPREVYLVAGSVTGLEPGVYHYHGDRVHHNGW
jgi:hypothetical protein